MAHTVIARVYADDDGIMKRVADAGYVLSRMCYWECSDVYTARIEGPGIYGDGEYDLFVGHNTCIALPKRFKWKSEYLKRLGDPNDRDGIISSFIKWLKRSWKSSG